MSVNQKKNFLAYRNLMRDLCLFGLNPRHWRFSRNLSNSKTIILENNFDPNFRFVGELSEAMQLESLELLSI